MTTQDRVSELGFLEGCVSNIFRDTFSPSTSKANRFVFLRNSLRMKVNEVMDDFKAIYDA